MPVTHELEKYVLLLKGVELVKDYAIFSLDPKGCITTWNTGAENIKGYKADEIIGQPIERFFEPIAVQQGHMKEILRQAQEQGRYEEEGWRICKNGSKYWANVVITAIYTVTNIMVWTRAANGAFVDPQSCWEEFTGQPYAEHQQFGWLSMHHPAHREELKLIWEKAQETKTFLPQTALLWSKQYQSYRYVLIRAVPMLDEQGHIQEWVGTDTDIQDLRELKELKTKTDQLDLTLKAAHASLWYWDNTTDQIYWDDAMYPLFGIKLAEITMPITFNAMVERFVHSEDQQAIEQCAQQQKTIVDDVLDLSKLDANRIEINKAPLNIGKMIQTIIQMHQPEIARKHLKLSIFINGCKDYWIVADEHRLMQMLTNLLSNAIKFTSAGSITIRVKILPSVNPEELPVKFSVEDTGIGMDPTELSQLFDRFAQANRRISSQYGGSGLGLIISKGLIEAMKGQLMVKSEKGQGSKFSFAVPCALLTTEEQLKLMEIPKVEQAEKSMAKPVTKIILVVEDNPVNQKMLVKFLEQAGHICQVANNGQEALEKYQRMNFDLIFMDIEMPVMGGLEATQKIRAYEQESNLPATPIIGLSGNVRKEQIDVAKEVGMDDYITKPYLKETVYHKIATYGNLKSNMQIERSVKQRRAEEQTNVIPISIDNRAGFFSHSTSSKEVSLSILPLSLDKFKTKAEWLLKAQLPFTVQIQENCLFITLLPLEEYELDTQDCGWILNYLKRLLNNNNSIWGIQENIVNEKCLRIKTEQALQTQAIQNFLNEAGFANTTNLTVLNNQKSCHI